MATTTSDRPGPTPGSSDRPSPAPDPGGPAPASSGPGAPGPSGPAPGSSGPGAPAPERPGRRWPSLGELYTLHREGPVTTSERRRSVVCAVVAMVLLAGGVGVLHLIDGSRELDGSSLIAFGVVGAVVALLGYAFPRFTTTPGLAMMSRHPDRNSTSSKVALVLFGLMLFVIAAVKLYY